MANLGTMLGEIVHSLFVKPATEKYPFEIRLAPVRLRGKLHWDPAKCTGCQLCIKDCPSEALELVVLDKAARRYVMRYRTDRCTYCAQCVENCRPKCISMSNEEWELASAGRDPFLVYYGREEDVRTTLAKLAQDATESNQSE